MGLSRVRKNLRAIARDVSHGHECPEGTRPHAGDDIVFLRSAVVLLPAATPKLLMGYTNIQPTISALISPEKIRSTQDLFEEPREKAKETSLLREEKQSTSLHNRLVRVCT